MNYNILVINPGSTSDDIGYYRGGQAVFEIALSYSPGELAPFENKNIAEMAPLKKQLILETLAKHNVPLKEINAVIGRGGLTKPVQSGVYDVNPAMLEVLKSGKYGQHASNLGGILASEIAGAAGCPAFTTDPVVVDEMQPLARYSGMPELPRISIFHALNQKRVAHLTAQKLNKKYEDCKFVILHAGGGVSVGAHLNGRVIDVTNALDGEGPMSPQRSGTVPTGAFAKMCLSGKYTPQQIALKIKGRGGMVAHTGTNSFKELREFIESGVKAQSSSITCTREEAKTFADAMIYQFTKYIGYMAAALEGGIDAVIITGGLAYNKYVTDAVKQKTQWICKNTFIYPGSDEKAALKEAACAALKDPKIVKEYK